MTTTDPDLLLCASDVGGTFTDTVVFHQGVVSMLKVPTTYPDPSVGVLTGVRRLLDQLGLSGTNVTHLIHGSTVGINAIIQRRGAKVALVTTEGFRDVLQIGRQTRPSLYDLNLDRLPALVSRDARHELRERMLADGSVRTALADDDLTALAQRLRHEAPDAVAICLLHSYANADHERRAEEAVRAALPDTFVCASAGLMQEFREYERTSTTVINAYVGPLTARYVSNLLARLSEMGCTSISIMQADGGSMTPGQALVEPVRTIESGPAGGVIGAAFVSRALGRDKVIAFDMGGTTTKASLVLDGEPGVTNNYEVCPQIAGDKLVAGSGYPVRTPVVDLVEVGAGGGSVAWLDPGGILRVGPQSAGSEPGPACYARGGLEPTVTDANVVLGRIDASGFGASDMTFDVSLAEKAIRPLADALELSVHETAEGIVRVANATMVRGVRLVTVERGHDVRDFSLIASGGASPAHVGQIADELGLREVVIPPSPGVFSAQGFLWALPRSQHAQTWLRPLTSVDPDELDAILDRLTQRAADQLGVGTGEPRLEITRSLELRYEGQSYELEVVLGPARTDQAALHTARAGFDAKHKEAYGFASADSAVEVVSVRVTTTLARTQPALRSQDEGDSDPQAAQIGVRQAYFGAAAVECAVYDRGLLYPGNVICGPALIQEPGSTHVLFPGRTARVDRMTNLIDTKELNA